ncbi:ArsR/SmtB family transcription factor [Streptomyces sp. NPDC012888]|uniref:ArsR/SmtB family transcription factor n=1 Tax=Streptomyces sp. NPDC012888 TaxID=3364855 RepID=UPI0036BD8FA9
MPENVDENEHEHDDGVGEPGGGAAERSVRVLDARSLRGLAHPLRVRLLSELRRNGPATASKLAAKLGESSGATSYHLRQLAAHGFVEDAPQHGKGRERWWRSCHDGTALDDSLINSPDPEVRGAAGFFLHEVATIHTQELNTFLGTSHEWSEEWRRSSDVSDFTLRLTPEDTRELVEKLHALIDGYADRPRTDRTETVRFHVHGFPRLDDAG